MPGTLRVMRVLGNADTQQPEKESYKRAVLGGVVSLKSATHHATVNL